MMSVTIDVGAARPNDQAWSSAAMAAIPAYIVLLIVIVPRYPGMEYVKAGEVLVPTALGAVAVGAAASSSLRVWRWWYYLGAVTAAAGLIAGVLELKDAVESRGDTSQGPGSTLSAPDTAGDWTLADNGGARTRGQAQLALVNQHFDGELSLVYGEYRNGIGRVVFQGLNAIPDSEWAAELQESPAAGVRNYFADAGMTSPQFVESGSDEAIMACDELAQPRQIVAVACVWADSTALGITGWITPELNVDRAAELTRQFRSAVSQPNT